MLYLTLGFIIDICLHRLILLLLGWLLYLIKPPLTIYYLFVIFYFIYLFFVNLSRTNNLVYTLQRPYIQGFKRLLLFLFLLITKDDFFFFLNLISNLDLCLVILWHKFVFVLILIILLLKFLLCLMLMYSARFTI